MLPTQATGLGLQDSIRRLMHTAQLLGKDHRADGGAHPSGGPPKAGDWISDLLQDLGFASTKKEL